jgi:hypothetical protein
VSSFHRDIAVGLIFHTLDLYFGEDPDYLNRGLDVFDRVKADPGFAARIKTLRLHWSYEEGDMLDLMARRSSIVKILVDIKLSSKGYFGLHYRPSKLCVSSNGSVIRKCGQIWCKPY